MIQGLQYCSGPYTVEHAEPASAFSRGDVLVLTSVSSVSRIADAFPAGDIYGIAMCDSLQSINKRVPVLIPETGTEFLASFNSASGSAISVGAELDINFGAPNGRYFVTTSTDSVRVVVTRGVVGLTAMDQSVHSQVRVRLIHNAGNLELS